jgi:hypothetical protein
VQITVERQLGRLEGSIELTASAESTIREERDRLLKELEDERAQRRRLAERLERGRPVAELSVLRSENSELRAQMLRERPAGRSRAQGREQEEELERRLTDLEDALSLKQGHKSYGA